MLIEQDDSISDWPDDTMSDWLWLLAGVVGGAFIVCILAFVGIAMLLGCSSC